MNTPKPMFVREVARVDDPQFVSGQVAGHRARRLIDAPDAAFADPFVLMAEDWTLKRSQTAIIRAFSKVPR
jgi:hypothetical protein